MDDRQIEPLIRQTRHRNGSRFAEAAYYFVLESLDYTLFTLGRNRLTGEDRHLTADELLDGIRRYAQEEFGPLARFAFRSWGVERTDDFGSLVFEMIESGLLNKQESDRLADFEDVYDFDEVFAELSPPAQ